jgi:phosphoserine phosphatase
LLIVLPIRLVVFDVDGTLTKHKSVWWRLHEAFGTTKEGGIYFDQYFAGEISYQEWADLDAGLWKHKPVEVVMDLVRNTELVPGAKEAVEALHKKGIHTAILSGGLDLMADHIASRVGIDYVLTNKLEQNSGMLTGRVEVLVGWGEKVKEIKMINDHFKIPLSQTAFVGDGKNDISVFSVVGLSIAYNPEHDEVAEAADFTVRDNDLRAVVPLILGHGHENIKTKT